MLCPRNLAKQGKINYSINFAPGKQPQSFYIAKPARPRAQRPPIFCAKRLLYTFGKFAVRIPRRHPRSCNGGTDRTSGSGRNHQDFPHGIERCGIDDVRENLRTGASAKAKGRRNGKADGRTNPS
jgi:hypothetical protein